MSEQVTGHAADGLWRAKALHALSRSVIGSRLPDSRIGLAAEVVTVFMKAGLPIADLQADGFEGRCGVALSTVPGLGGLQVLWCQHPYMGPQNEHVWGAQEAAMHEALRSVLAVHGFWLTDQPTGEAPIIMGLVNPATEP